MTIDLSQRTCPLPHTNNDCFLLAHGEGAGLTRKFLDQYLRPLLDNRYLMQRGDAAVLAQEDHLPVISTDSYVVSPLFFPGGDIGCLAVHGTVNDLAVTGATPKYLTLSLMIEEGLPLATMERVLQSVADSAQRCRVQVVAGDTKVVPRGHLDQLFINTTGIGYRPHAIDWGMPRIQPGDHVLLSGTMGDHGLAILAAREQLHFAKPIKSDTTPLHELVNALQKHHSSIHCMRDPTRGGVAAVLHEMVEGTGFSIRIYENQLPIRPDVRGACEILGLNPIYIANEGKAIVVVAPEAADSVLSTMREHPLGRDAARIGIIESKRPPLVWIEGLMGIARVLDEPSGAPLPRIC